MTMTDTVTAPEALAGRPLTPEERARAGQIADALGERARTARHQIARIVRVVGAERAGVFFTEAQAVEAGGGLPIHNGRRRRTPGGVFFHLVRTGVMEAERVAIFGRSGGGAEFGGNPASPAGPVLARWDAAAVGEVMALAPAAMGGATSVKITVVGRPGKVVEREGVVAVALVSAGMPSLPKGLPVPGTTRTRYVVLIARKQWTKVAAALADPADTLIVEGYPALEERFAGAITVYATRVTTKQLQAAQKAETAVNVSAASTG